MRFLSAGAIRPFYRWLSLAILMPRLEYGVDTIPDRFEVNHGMRSGRVEARTAV
jgi:hypothetical protein